MPPKKPLTSREELLKIRLEQINQLPISDKAKTFFMKTIAANQSDAQGEGLEFALKSIPKERLAIVTETAKKMHVIGQTVARRGRASLSALSDAEWDKLVNEAAKDSEK